MAKTIKIEFTEYLKAHGYKEKTSKGRKSTIYSYINKIEWVCDYENISWEVLANNIEHYINEYDEGGAKQELGKKSNSTVINALKRYQEYLP